MSHSLRSSTLVPRGFVVSNTAIHEGVTLIAIRPASTASLGPVCGSRPERNHSRYQQRLSDLSLAGKPVRLAIDARRFVEHVERTMTFDDEFAESFKPMDYLQLSAVGALQAFDAIRAASNNCQKTSLMALYGPKPIFVGHVSFRARCRHQGAAGSARVLCAASSQLFELYSRQSMFRNGELHALAYSVKYGGVPVYSI